LLLLLCLLRLLAAGKDATQDFEEIGHSNSARELLEKYHIGGFAVGADQLAWLAAALAQGGIRGM
jgi:cytochrome b involved in lipid metabolism